MINQVTTYLEMIGKNWIQILAPLLDDNPSSQNECSSGFARFKSQLSQTTSDSLAHAGTTCFSVSKDSIKIFSRVRCWLTSLTRRSGGGGKSMLEVQISTLRIGRTLFFRSLSLLQDWYSKRIQEGNESFSVVSVIENCSWRRIPWPKA